MTDSKKTNPFDLSAGVPGIDGALRPTPKFADRISKRVLIVSFAVAVLIVGIFLLSLDHMDAKKGHAQEKEKKVQNQPAPKDEKLSTYDPSDPIGGSNKRPSLVTGGAVPPAADIGTLNTKTDGSANNGGKSSIPPGTSGTTAVPPLTPEQQAEKQEAESRRTRMNQARANGMEAKSFDAKEQTAIALPTNPNGSVMSGMSDLLNSAKTSLGQATSGVQQAKQDGEQDEKMSFIKDGAKDDRGYHPHVALPALSPNEVKTGSYIPMTLEQKINSDLPGQITARVTEDVYDTISGCRLLIPAMSKAVGKYDSKVALGQGRMLVVWNSLIFPNGDELNLAGMQGYDTGGEAGLESDVDNHYWRLFGLTFGLSMITAGVQLSVPQPNPGANGAVAPQTSGQIVSTSLAQQYGNLGAQIIGKYMAVQPTLRNYAGERFMIMVPHTVVFTKVWRDRCSISR